MFRIAILSLTLLLSGQINAESEFWQLDQYWHKHPNQKALSKSFADLIRNPAIPLSTVQEKPILVYFITPSRQLSDYWRRNKIAFSNRLDELGIKYTIKSHDIKANSDEDKKLKLLEHALSKHPDFLILTLDMDPNTSSIRHILNTNKTRLILQNVTNPLKSLHKNKPLLYVGFDHQTGTKMLAQYFKETFPNATKFAVNNFKPGYISEVRGKSFITMMERNSRFEMVSHLYTDATQGSARSNTMNLVDQHPDLDFIYACATDIAIGTSKALQILGRQDIKVNGWGGGSKELQALAEGVLDVTVMRMNDDNGVAMAEAVKLVLEQKEDEVPVVYTGDFKLVTSRTKQAEIEQLIKHAFRYSDRH
ncbi:MAG: autoinducer 2-binding protein LuxP [Oleiphilaceae bacterium]|jgi:autoinducer 2-binding protein LuxP